MAQGVLPFRYETEKNTTGMTALAGLPVYLDLFPPSVQSLIADDHLCIIVNDVVNAVDLSCLYKKVSREGNPPYHPAMMLKILFYAYTHIGAGIADL